MASKVGFHNTPGINIIKQGIFEESETAKYRVGDVLRLSDGRAFRYAKNGAAALTGHGKMLQSAGDIETDKIVYTAAIGASTIGLKTSSAQASSTEEGYLNINDGTGQGQYFKVRYSEAHPSSASHTLITVYDPVTTATAVANSKGSLSYNPWMKVVIQASSTEWCCGVQLIPVTASYYFWVQTWGICCVLSGDTAGVGARLTTNASNFTETVAEAAASIIQTYGTAYSYTHIDTDYDMVYLTIAP